MRIKELRTEKHLTQQKLADILGVSRSALASWESGVNYPEVTTLQKIADYFNVSTDYLLERVDKKSEKELLNAPFITLLQPDEIKIIRNKLCETGEKRGYSLSEDQIDIILDKFTIAAWLECPDSKEKILSEARFLYERYIDLPPDKKAIADILFQRQDHVLEDLITKKELTKEVSENHKKYIFPDKSVIEIKK